MLGTDNRIILKCLLKKGNGRFCAVSVWLIIAGYFVRRKQSLISTKDGMLILEIRTVVISALSYYVNLLFCGDIRRLFPSTVIYDNIRHLKFLWL